MKKTRILSLLLALVLVGSALGGCSQEPAEQQGSSVDTQSASQPVSSASSQEGTDSNSETQSQTERVPTAEVKAFTDKIGRLVDLSRYNDHSTGNESCHFALPYEEEAKLQFPGGLQIQLGTGKAFTLPIAYADLEKLGWKASNVDMEEMLEPNHYTFGSVSKIANSKGQEALFGLHHNSQQALPYKECDVYALKVTMYNSFDHSQRYDTAAPFTLCGSITQNSTVADVIHALGSPDAISYYVSYKADGQYNYSTTKLTFRQTDRSELVFEFEQDKMLTAKCEYNIFQ